MMRKAEGALYHPADAAVRGPATDVREARELAASGELFWRNVLAKTNQLLFRKYPEIATDDSLASAVVERFFLYISQNHISSIGERALEQKLIELIQDELKKLRNARMTQRFRERSLTVAHTDRGQQIEQDFPDQAPNALAALIAAEDTSGAAATTGRVHDASMAMTARQAEFQQFAAELDLGELSSREVERLARYFLNEQIPLITGQRTKSPALKKAVEAVRKKISGERDAFFISLGFTPADIVRIKKDIDKPHLPAITIMAHTLHYLHTLGFSDPLGVLGTYPKIISSNIQQRAEDRMALLKEVGC